MVLPKAFLQALAGDGLFRPPVQHAGRCSGRGVSRRFSVLRATGES